jgi:diguanylate cyclase (GGDEF)-like protein
MKTLLALLDKLSIRSKLMVIITGISLVVLLSLFVVSVLTQRGMLREALKNEVQILAQDLSRNCSAALVFDDRQAAGETLGTLQSKPQVAFGSIVTVDGGLFAKYQRGPDLERSDNLRLDLPAGNQRGAFFVGDFLKVSQPILFNNEQIGTLNICAGLDRIQQVLLRYVTLGLLGLAGAALLAWLLALWLQGLISRPIENLAATMLTVSSEQDYSRRVAMERSDELGTLVENFNEMLNQIQVRDADLQEKQQRLNYLAYHDALTGLANRLLFDDRLQHALENARRLGNRVALFFIDLDRFKNINDSLGHKTGDMVLKEVSARLSAVIRAGDTLARLGGDEFVVICEQAADRQGIAILATKVQQVLNQPLQCGRQDLFVSGSIGVSVFPDDGECVESLMQCADVAMYQAKELGRNNFQFFTPGMTELAQEALLMESKLRKALENGELLLHYQPQVDMSSGCIIGMEALLRWQHPVMGLVSPAKFIPLAEETGLIISIGKWVLQQACRQAMLWQQAGYPAWTMAVNISPKQFWQADLIDAVEKALEETGLDPTLLELEITESAIMQDAEKAIDTMRRVRERGIKLAIDDFGTGYSSLSCLRRFPLSKLKIDQSFTRDILIEEDGGAIAEGIMALARTLKLDVIAEGVEEAGQVEFLLAKGCTEGQGYHLGRPMPAEGLVDYYLHKVAGKGEVPADSYSVLIGNGG